MAASKAKSSCNADIEADRSEQALRHAVAQQKLEGLVVSEETIQDMRRAAAGEIDDDDVIANILARHSVCRDIQKTIHTSTPPAEH